MGLFFPLSIEPSGGGIWTASNAWFLGPTQVHNPNGILIGSAVLQASWLWLTNRQTILLGL